VYQLKIDREAAIIEVELDGTLRGEDTARFGRELQEAIGALAGREIRVELDARTLRPVAPEVAEMLRHLWALAIRSGVRRIAELAPGGVVGLQLGRIAQESGADRILRRFVDERAAGDWLREAEPPSQRTAAVVASGRRTASRAQIEAAVAPPASEPPLSPRRTTWRDLTLEPAPLSPRRFPGPDGKPKA
jgi:hypothetical protein